MEPFVFFGSNPLGQRILRWLAEQHVRPIKLVTGRTRAADLDELQGCDRAISVGHRFILGQDVIARFPAGIINLHTGLLPWNRGAHPNVWPLMDGSPAGATLHHIDKGVDTGDIVGQQELGVWPWDTAESLYQRLEQAAFALFIRSWPFLWDLPRIPQNQQGGSSHKAADLAELDTLRLTPEVRYAINQLRARTFLGHPGVRWREGGELVEATITLRRVGG